MEGFCKSRMWRLELDSATAKHGLFSQSKAFRQQRIYFNDDPSGSQLQGQQILAAQKLQLQEQGHATWWRRDALCWKDGMGVHREVPERP